jgi:hypothetical protein
MKLRAGQGVFARARRKRLTKAKASDIKGLPPDFAAAERKERRKQKW